MRRGHVAVARRNARKAMGSVNAELEVRAYPTGNCACQVRAGRRNLFRGLPSPLRKHVQSNARCLASGCLPRSNSVVGPQLRSRTV